MIITRAMPGLSGSLVSLRATNPKLAMAMSAAPNYDLVAEMLRDLVEGIKDIQPTTSREGVAADIYASLASGDGVPADTLARYTAAADAERGFVFANEDLSILHARLVQDRDFLVQNELPTMCRALHADLQRVYTELRELSPVSTSADQAIADGKVSQYKKAAGLRVEYVQIRAAHRALLSGGLAKSQDETFRFLSQGWPVVAYASGLGAIWPDLPEWHKYGKKLGVGGQPVKVTPPWPDPDSEAFLDWLLEHPEAGPWVPTFEEARDLLNQIKSSAQTLHVTTRSPDSQALAREYDRRKRMWGSGPGHVIN